MPNQSVLLYFILFASRKPCLHVHFQVMRLHDVISEEAAIVLERLEADVNLTVELADLVLKALERVPGYLEELLRLFTRAGSKLQVYLIAGELQSKPSPSMTTCCVFAPVHNKSVLTGLFLKPFMNWHSTDSQRHRSTVFGIMIVDVLSEALQRKLATMAVDGARARGAMVVHSAYDGYSYFLAYHVGPLLQNMSQFYHAWQILGAVSFSVKGPETLKNTIVVQPSSLTFPIVDM